MYWPKLEVSGHVVFAASERVHVSRNQAGPFDVVLAT
jgi:hypothetical protein